MAAAALQAWGKNCSLLIKRRCPAAETPNLFWQKLSRCRVKQQALKSK
jgi:hypothetical protein